LDFHKSENQAELADEVNAVYNKVEAAPQRESTDRGENDDPIFQRRSSVDSRMSRSSKKSEKPQRESTHFSIFPNLASSNK
jgi:hypothetical protein